MNIWNTSFFSINVQKKSLDGHLFAWLHFDEVPFPPVPRKKIGYFSPPRHSGFSSRFPFRFLPFRYSFSPTMDRMIRELEGGTQHYVGIFGPPIGSRISAIHFQKIWPVFYCRTLFLISPGNLPFICKKKALLAYSYRVLLLLLLK